MGKCSYSDWDIAAKAALLEVSMRSSGVLMHISSLPSPFGIGTMGEAAREFVNFLSASDQRYWQVLPVSPTGYGDSPYQSFSSYAGNPYFIDLDELCAEGLLEPFEYREANWGGDPERVDYGLLYEKRFPLLRRACERLLSRADASLNEFFSLNAFWLDNYALFMALKDAHGGAAWTSWEPALRFRDTAALDFARTAYADSIAFYKALQYLFFRQWRALRHYANERGISIIGDMPIYVAPDSADVWAEPQWFMLDSNLFPTEVAGCPPDGFSADGQLWGNPLYNWEENKKSGYSWWIRRAAHQFELYDALRIDHFRGFDTFYAIPAGSENARQGVWRDGPGIELFTTIKNALGDRNFIAEDLGFLTPSVRHLVSESGFPGMKVLQFAFDSREDSDYLPHNFTKNCVAYTGTHDNDTILGWFKTASPDDTKKARDYLRIHQNESEAFAMLSALWGSVSDLVIAQMQDLLELDSRGRMNTPGTMRGNWQWRMSPNAETDKIMRRLAHMTRLYGRA
ncbi:MAG: 4-alpha-glucanotransferase [Oscillospiraceae bacterium]